MALYLKKTSFTKSSQREEIIKCGKSPSYFFNTYCMIQSEGGRCLFETYGFQDDCLDVFRKNKHVIVNKSRQLGLSTLVSAYAVWLALFRRDQNILVLATKLSVAKNFINKCSFILKNLPEWMTLYDVQCNIQDILIDNGSKIQAIPTSKDAGRSEALTLLIIDEAAHIEGLDTIWTGLSPTISQSKGSVIFISSPLGTGNLFYEICKKAEKKENEFRLIELPWDVHPERDTEWFEQQKRAMNGDLKKIAQEFECSFNSSGNTILDVRTLENLRKSVCPPAERGHHDRNLWIWKHPVMDHNYILSADTALGQGKDYSAFHIIDETAQEVVAEYAGKEETDKFAELINIMGLKYNTALVCPENNSYGHSTIMWLRNLKYPRLYSEESRSKTSAYGSPFVSSEESRKYGLNMYRYNRPAIIAKMEEVLRNGNIKLYSSRTINELFNFVLNSSNKAVASKGRNDDLVMSLAIGIWLMSESNMDEYTDDMSRALLQNLSVKSVSSNQVMGEMNQKEDYNVFIPTTINSYGLASGLPEQRTKGFQLNKNWAWLYKR